MRAFAEDVTKKIQPKQFADHFDGMTMTAPCCKEAGNNPEHHSTVGQKLLCVKICAIWRHVVHTQPAPAS